MDTLKGNDKSDSGYSSLELKAVFAPYLRRWYFFVMGLFFSLLCAFVYIKYLPKQYEASATVLVKDGKGSSALLADELSAFEDMGIFKSQKNILNERQIMLSRSVMERIVRRHKLNIQYFTYGRPVYHHRSHLNSPVLMEFIPSDSASESLAFSEKIIVLSQEEYKFDDNPEDVHYRFGDTVQLNYGRAILKTTPWLQETYFGLGLLIQYVPVVKCSMQFLSQLSVTSLDEDASVLKLNLKDYDLARATFILEELLRQHNADAIDDKNQIAKNTSDFISGRIDFVLNELSGVEGAAENFKEEHSLTDIVTDTKMRQEALARNNDISEEYRNRLVLTELLMSEVMSKSNDAGLIPSNLGLSSERTDELIQNYNVMALEYERILKNSGAQHPVLKDMFGKLVSAKANIIESLKISVDALKERIRQMEFKENQLKNEIREVPRHERVFRDIQRQQQVKESLYLYLLEKREEANIALAVTVSNLRIIDPPYGADVSISPKKGIIYMASGFVGLVLPMLLIYLWIVLDSKVRSKKDLSFLGIPFLGEIPVLEVKSYPVFSESDRSVASECFRLIKSNLDYMLSNTEKGRGKVLFVSSTISNEGKSLIGINLAAALAASGKSVILMGTDLRHPKLVKYLGIKEKMGLSNFLSDESISMDAIIQSMPENFTFSLITSGPIPPNPSELLASDRMKDFMKYLKGRFDYVVVDTAPIGLVSDTLTMSEIADAVVYVVRANLLDKRELSVLDEMNQKKRFKNLCLVLNAYEAHRSNDYGYGYGYGYYAYGYGAYYGNDGDNKPKGILAKWNVFAKSGNSKNS